MIAVRESSVNATDVQTSIAGFVEWLDRYGETSYDHQSYFAGPLGRRAKALYYRNKAVGTLAVAPMIASEAVLPSARRLFWKRQRFPIADAHYASGFALLAAISGKEADKRRAIHFLEVLVETRSPGFVNFTWGYPFDWVTVRGTIAAGTPLITTVPYVYEAFRQVYQLDQDRRWCEIMRSTTEHAYHDYEDFETSIDAATCSYVPKPVDLRGVINASAYRAFLLTQAASDFTHQAYAEGARRNLNFVLESQNPNGSWYYAMDGQRDFVDHFHTCFVLKALAKIERLSPSPEITRAIELGVSYYVEHLFDPPGLPRPFSRAPRLTVYRRELYDYAECINLAVLLRGRFKQLDRILAVVVDDLLTRWRKPDGSFRARQLLVGWDNVPMHRWAQAQLFRSLCALAAQERSIHTPLFE